MPDWTLIFDGAPEDQDFWLEAADIEKWIEAGSPPVEQWRGAPAGKRARTPPKRPGPPRLAFSLKDAADALGMSEDHFREHVKPKLKIVREPVCGGAGA